MNPAAQLSTPSVTNIATQRTEPRLAIHRDSPFIQYLENCLTAVPEWDARSILRNAAQRLMMFNLAIASVGHAPAVKCPETGKKAPKW